MTDGDIVIAKHEESSYLRISKRRSSLSSFGSRSLNNLSTKSRNKHLCAHSADDYPLPRTGRRSSLGDNNNIVRASTKVAAVRRGSTGGQAFERRRKESINIHLTINVHTVEIKQQLEQEECSAASNNLPDASDLGYEPVEPTTYRQSIANLGYEPAESAYETRSSPSSQIDFKGVLADSRRRRASMSAMESGEAGAHRLDTSNLYEKLSTSRRCLYRENPSLENSSNHTSCSRSRDSPRKSPRSKVSTTHHQRAQNCRHSDGAAPLRAKSMEFEFAVPHRQQQHRASVRSTRAVVKRSNNEFSDGTSPLERTKSNDNELVGHDSGRRRSSLRGARAPPRIARRSRRASMSAMCEALSTSDLSSIDSSIHGGVLTRRCSLDNRSNHSNLSGENFNNNRRGRRSETNNTDGHNGFDLSTSRATKKCALERKNSVNDELQLKARGRSEDCLSVRSLHNPKCSNNWSPADESCSRRRLSLRSLQSPKDRWCPDSPQKKLSVQDLADSLHGSDRVSPNKSNNKRLSCRRGSDASSIKKLSLHSVLDSKELQLAKENSEQDENSYCSSIDDESFSSEVYSESEEEEFASDQPPVEIYVNRPRCNTTEN